MTRASWMAMALLVLPMSARAADVSLSVTGLVGHPLHLSMAELRAFPAMRVTATQASGRGPVKLDCTGAALSALLDKAVLNVGKANNASLGHTLLITADDGYVVALSLGEIDPDYGNIRPIIATECSGKPLEAPRLVIPSDKHGGRAVKGMVAIAVK